MTESTRPIMAILANRGFAISNSRLPLIKRMQDAGWDLLLITSDDIEARSIESSGVQLETVQFYRGGLSPIKDTKALIRLIRIFSKRQPSLIHFFHAKPILLGMLAVACTMRWRPKCVSTITGLGRAYVDGGFRWFLASIGYRILMKRSDATIFQNRDDHQLFLSRNWVSAERAHLITSSGVDLTRFHPNKQVHDGKKVLMAGRLIHQKGVFDYFDAVRLLKNQHINTTFLVAGEIEAEHPDAVTQDEIGAATRETGIRFLGFVTDIDALLPTVDVFVFPSYYREGLPRVVIEAAACGVPTVGADAPGTRDAIEDGITGFLVPPRESRVLADRISQLLADEQLRSSMGNAARKKAGEEFDVEVITNKQLKVYSSILSGTVLPVPKA